jgi:hypothetical protein
MSWLLASLALAEPVRLEDKSPPVLGTGLCILPNAPFVMSKVTGRLSLILAGGNALFSLHNVLAKTGAQSLPNPICAR